MKKLMRCPACGRHRKKQHEARAGTPRAYSPGCNRYHKNEKKGKKQHVESPK